jgi:hypothetical protein
MRLSAAVWLQREPLIAAALLLLFRCDSRLAEEFTVRAEVTLLDREAVRFLEAVSSGRRLLKGRLSLRNRPFNYRCANAWK